MHVGNVKPLKLFKADHDGNMIFGISVVVAATKQQAMKLLRKKLEELKVGKDLSKDSIDMEEIDLTIPSVHVLFDGVY